MLAALGLFRAYTTQNASRTFEIEKRAYTPFDPTKISQEKTAPSLIYKENENENEPPNTFLESRKITQAVQTERKRKQQSVTGNLMSPSKKRVLKEINIEQQPTQNKKTANKTKSKQRKSQTINKHLFNSTTGDYFRTTAAATTIR